MPIGAAIALGVGLGIGATELMFNYTKRDYEVKVDKLETLIRELENHLSKLRELRSSVPSFWDDDEGRKTCQILDEMISKVVNKMDQAKSLTRIYKNAISEFDTSKSVMVETLESAFGLLSGLGD